MECKILPDSLAGYLPAGHEMRMHLLTLANDLRTFIFVKVRLIYLQTKKYNEQHSTL